MKRSMRVNDRFTVKPVSSWRTHRVVAALAVVAFVTIQLAIPISRFGSNEAAPRFAWQMFSTVREAPDFVVETGSETIEIPLNDYMAGARGDVDIEGLMPAHLCSLFPAAIRVTWQWDSYPC